MVLPILVLSLILLSQGNSNFYSNSNSEINVKPHMSAPTSLKAEWYRTWGGTETDEAMTINIDSLDGIYLAGYTRNYSSVEQYLNLVKYNNNGELQWNRTWGEEGFYSASQVTIDSLNNIYLTGTKDNPGQSNSLIYIIKFNSSGYLEWNRTWAGNEEADGGEIALDSLNNLYLTGRTYNESALTNEIYLIKFNSSGHLEWNRTNGNTHLWFSRLVIDSSDDIYLTGIDFVGGTGNDDLYIWKYNSTGHLQWNNTLGEIDFAVFPHIAIDSSDNIYISGSTANLGEINVILIKYDITGTQLWNRTWVGISDEYVFNIAIDSSDNIYIGGQVRGGSYSNGTHWSDIFLIKYDNSGIKLWNQTWDKSKEDEIWDLTLNSLGNIYLAGYVEGNMMILRFDRFGSFISYTSWGGDQGDYATGIALDSSEEIYISGTTRSFGAGNGDMCIVKFVESAESIIPGYDLVSLILIFSGVSIISIISRFRKTLFRKKLNV